MHLARSSLTSVPWCSHDVMGVVNVCTREFHRVCFVVCRVSAVLKKYQIGNSLMRVLGRNEHPGRVKGSEPCVHSSSVGGNSVRPLICYFIDPLQSHKEFLK